LSQDKTEFIRYFKEQFYLRYEKPYIPSQKDHGQAKFLVENFGVDFSKALAEKFFELVGYGKFKKAPPTVSCMSYNRNDLIAEISRVEEPVLEDSKFF
jgi:hypothetical protein